MADFARLRFTTFGPSYSLSRLLLLEMVAQGAATIDRPFQSFSPISTISLNRAIDAIVASCDSRRLYHLTSQPISKTDCCARLAHVLGITLPPFRLVEDSPSDLSLTSESHSFVLADEITLAITAWRGSSLREAAEGAT
jgi:hypothetical protein